MSKTKRQLTPGEFMVVAIAATNAIMDSKSLLKGRADLVLPMIDVMEKMVREVIFKQDADLGLDNAAEALYTLLKSTEYELEEK